MRYLLDSGGLYSVHFKTSDRPKRKYDDLELISDQNFNPQDFDYVYQTYGHRYGMQRSQIDASIQQNKHHFIICNDLSTIQALKRDYGESIKTVFFYFDAPEEALLEIQKSRGINDDEIQLRLAKTAALNRQFCVSYELFDGTLANHFQEGKDALEHRMETLLAQFADHNKSLLSNLRSLATDLSKSIEP